ncbi:hypothetical protein Ciccas_003949 [Cichlidogyrus casuarinus]|uniref:BTB domain-containing protein n=1 Tax=Cichlidogyrus casuarinus TaxID=1844966 RepID=A0ABD2QCZ8_9PLAT
MDNVVRSNKIVALNVGGKLYETTEDTLTRHQNTFLSRLSQLDQKDASGRYFIDRDGKLFRYILDYCRYGVESVPKQLNEATRLRAEAEFYELPELVGFLDQMVNPDISLIQGPSCIIIGYRGSFASGKEGVGDLRFRKVGRILVHGQTSACRQIFGESLNESRDPDIGNQYSCRFFLNSISLEQAFDLLYRARYRLVTSCASGTNAGHVSNEAKFAMDVEELRWQHYTEFVFVNAPLY